MAGLCALMILLHGFVCAWKTNFLSKTGDKKCKEIPVRKQWELNPCQLFCMSGCIPPPCVAYYCSGTMYRPRDEKNF